jgi:hypothetical protein
VNILIFCCFAFFFVTFDSSAGFLVRVHPEPSLIQIRAQIRALLCSSKSKFIPA